MRCLIINRGEIALRAIQSCRELAMTSVWLTQEDELKLEPALRADEVIAYPRVAESNVYMDLNLIERAILDKNISHVYPGYGFMSENYKIAELCEKLNVQFIGPNSTVLKSCAQKSQIHKLVKSYGIATLTKDLDQIDLKKDSILVKASQGGGGRGHRIVLPGDNLQKKIEETVEISKRIFGSEEIHFEMYLSDIRHVEAQFGKTASKRAVLVGTRDCSIQRNFQKLIEEGEVKAEILKAIHDTFPKFQKLLDDVGYEGLGTIEYVWDINEKKLYFIEINCRIQVEHPVTELLTGQNLVTQQMSIFVKDDVEFNTESRGHVIECRIYGEDPLRDFIPTPFKLDYLSSENQPFVRWDWSLRQGDTISSMYDPMICKLIVWGANREEAIMRCKLALKGLVLHGPNTNQELLISIVDSEIFQKDQHNTSWLESYLPSWKKDMLDRKPVNLSFSFDPSDSTGQAQASTSWKSLHKFRDPK